LGVTAPSTLSRATLGEGNTSVAELRIDGRDVIAKLEFENPTNSFKDRGAVYLLAVALEAGATAVVADSSGNAGIAVATYAGHVGLDCEVFVPASTSLETVGRMSEAGARVRSVKGPREAAAAAAVARVAETGAFYASHVHNPWFFEGTKHIVLELHAQLQQRLPEVLVLPVGNGTLVLGAHRAMQELGVTVPIVAVQDERCAPLAQAFAAGEDHVKPVGDTGAMATGLAIGAPPRGDEVLAATRATGGRVVTVAERDLATAVALLEAHGFAVEPTAAAAIAAVPQVDASEIGLPISSGQLV
jgi:threonine synthase